MRYPDLVGNGTPLSSVGRRTGLGFGIGLGSGVNDEVGLAVGLDDAIGAEDEDNN
ncbi:hypothetical protein [Aliterella atlantica]|uniref:hypothetical protein n=1 Tax=Aliterella atlantica TaxID=1827278 RepID=UPI0030DA4C46